VRASPTPRAKPLATETEILRAFLLAVPHHLPGVLIFQRPILNAIATAGGKTFRVHSGVAGQADAYAVGRGGRYVELECKSARGTLAAAQERWRARCLALAIPHLVLRVGPGETPSQTVERWISELRGALEERGASAT
jgi:hypothetical protein